MELLYFPSNIHRQINQILNILRIIFFIFTRQSLMHIKSISCYIANTTSQIWHIDAIYISIFKAK